MADVTLPQLGETVTEGTITQWFKNVGDTVAADEPLFEVSTDKVDTEVPSPVSGVLTEIRVPEGDTVDVGTVIAVVGDSDAAPAAAPAAADPAEADAPAEAPPATESTAPAEAAPRPRPQHRPSAAPALLSHPPRRRRLPLHRRPRRLRLRPAPAAAPRRAAAASDNRLLSPVVRRLVNEHGLDPDSITGTGPGGRITRDDVLDHIDATGATPQAAAPPAAPAAAAPPPPRPPPHRPPRRLRPRPRAAPAPAPTAAPAAHGGRARHERAAVEDPHAHRQSHGDEQGHEPPRVQRGRGRLRQRRRRAQRR